MTSTEKGSGTKLKNPYASPQLTRIGSLREYTEGPLKGGADGASGRGSVT